MIDTNSLHKDCDELFADYPLAVNVDYHSGKEIRSMVLMLHEDDDTAFFLLSCHRSDSGSYYSISPWPAGEAVDIQADGHIVIPPVAAKAVIRGVPIPQDGSLFGWTQGEAITALVVIYATYTAVSPKPSWAVMPLVGVPEERWPPFTRERFLGDWFWGHHRAGRVVSLADLVAGMPDAVYWVDTKAALGSDCCVVARDARSPEGPVLQRGRYVYHQVLSAGMEVPSLALLLADPGKTDLAPQFQQPENSDDPSHGRQQLNSTGTAVA
jgi:hypothetical protein